MAEKEQRIFVTKIQPECKFRELHETTAGGHTWVDFMCGKSSIKNLECDDKCFEQCEWKELTGIARQEAIEKMAKALFNFQYDGGLSFEYAYDGAKKEFRLFAESALNALLEEDK